MQLLNTLKAEMLRWDLVMSFWNLGQGFLFRRRWVLTYSVKDMRGAESKEPVSILLIWSTSDPQNFPMLNAQS